MPQWVKVLVGLVKAVLVLMSWDPMLWALKGDMWVCLDKGVYHTDVNINCHAKNVIKYVGINIFSQ